MSIPRTRGVLPLIAALLALFAFSSPLLAARAAPSAPAAAAQVANGSRWAGGGGAETVTVNVTQNSSANDATVSFTDSHGTSPTTTGTLGEGSSEENPNVSESGSATTPRDSEGNDGTAYRVSDGKTQRKNPDGNWVNMREVKEKGATQEGRTEYLRAGDPAPWPGRFRGGHGEGEVPLQAGDPAPWNGWLTGPGEEVTSLPWPGSGG